MTSPQSSRSKRLSVSQSFCLKMCCLTGQRKNRRANCLWCFNGQKYSMWCDVQMLQSSRDPELTTVHRGWLKKDEPRSLPSTSLALNFYANIHLTARTMSPWHRNKHEIHQQSNRETKQRFISILLQHSGVERLSHSHLHTHDKKEERGNPLFQGGKK